MSEQHLNFLLLHWILGRYTEWSAIILPLVPTSIWLEISLFPSKVCALLARTWRLAGTPLSHSLHSLLIPWCPLNLKNDGLPLCRSLFLHFTIRPHFPLAVSPSVHSYSKSLPKSCPLPFANVLISMQCPLVGSFYAINSWQPIKVWPIAPCQPITLVDILIMLPCKIKPSNPRLPISTSMMTFFWLMCNLENGFPLFSFPSPLLDVCGHPHSSP